MTQVNGVNQTTQASAAGKTVTLTQEELVKIVQAALQAQLSGTNNQDQSQAGLDPVQLTTQTQPTTTSDSGSGVLGVLKGLVGDKNGNGILGMVQNFVGGTSSNGASGSGISGMAKDIVGGEGGKGILGMIGGLFGN